MKNYVGEGKTITITAAAAITSGDVVASNALLGVAQNDAANGAQVVLAIEGVFRIAKAVGVMNAGDKLDWDTSASNLGKGITPAAGDIEDCCVAMETVASGATTIAVKLLPGVGALT